MDLLNAAKLPFVHARKTLSGSLLYLDAGAAEAIHVNLGLKFLLELGVLNVCDLDKASQGDALAAELLGGIKISNLVIITTQLLTETHGALLRVLLANPEAMSCTVLCSVSEEAHEVQPGTALGLEPYTAYSAALKEDLEERRGRGKGGERGESPIPQVTIGVHYFPLHFCALTPFAFVLPAASSAASLSWMGRGPAGLVGSDEDPLRGDPSLDSPALFGNKILAHNLVGLAAQIGFRLQVFSLGPSSALLGSEMCMLVPPAGPGNRVPTETAALVLVDRCLDMVGPACHGDHLIDRVFGCLPRRQPGGTASRARKPGRVPWQPCDVAVHLYGLESGTAAVGGPPGSGSAGSAELPARDTGAEEPAGVPTGSVFAGAGAILGGPPPKGGPNPVLGASTGAPENPRGASLLQVLLSRSPREAALLLRKWLREAARAEHVTLQLRFKTGSVGPGELRALAQALGEVPRVAARHAEVIQLAHAAGEVLTGQLASRWDLLARQEKQLSALASEGVDSLAAEVCQLFGVAARAQGAAGELRLEDALLLLLAAYYLASPLPPPEPSGSRETAFPRPPQPSGFSPAQERDIVRAVVDASLKADHSRHSLTWLGPDLETRLRSLRDISEEGSHEEAAVRLELEDKVQEMIGHFRSLASSRGKCKALRSLLAPMSMGTSDDVPPLMKALVSACTSRSPIPDIQHHTASLRAALTSGLRQFGLVQKQPQPRDHDTIILFVVGGVTSAEVRELAAVVADLQPRPESPRTQAPTIFLGGTSMLRPSLLDLHLIPQ
eukprot:jgi/Botrbrau1/5105/Bobra.0128s0016.1